MDKIVTQYKKYRAHNRMLIRIMFILLFITGCMALVTGSYQISWPEIVHLLQGEVPLMRDEDYTYLWV